MDYQVKIEWRRDLFHLAGIAIPVGYLYFPKEVVLWGIGLASILYVGSDLLRLFHKEFAHFFCKIMGDLVKDRERKNLMGSSYFLIGAFFCVLLFPKEVALPALLVASISDVLASFIGSKWGRHPLRGSRTVEGSLCFFLSASFLILLFYPGPKVWGVLVGFFSSLIEAFSFGVDDNLSLPLGTAFLLWLFL